MNASTVAYLDASAVVKLVAKEAQGVELRAFLEGIERTVSSAMLETEVRRAVRRRAPDDDSQELDRMLHATEQVLAGLFLFAVDREVLLRAGDLQHPLLRSLDAIHLATALSVPSRPVAFVSYDERQTEVAEELGLSVATPGR